MVEGVQADTSMVGSYLGSVGRYIGQCRLLLY